MMLISSFINAMNGLIGSHDRLSVIGFITHVRSRPFDTRYVKTRCSTGNSWPICGTKKILLKIRTQKLICKLSVNCTLFCFPIFNKRNVEIIRKYKNQIKCISIWTQQLSINITNISFAKHLLNHPVN